jgi:hypothetical protein
MGVDVDAEVMIGVWFGSEDNAVKFAIENKLIALEEGEDAEEVIYGSGLVECLKSPLTFKDYSSYSDRGGCIGVEVAESDLNDSGGGGVADVWKEVLESLPEEVHEQIEAHIWARYW